MNESPNKRTVIVGLFVIVGLAFLLAGILMIGNLHETFKRKMKVVSIFDDVSGLQAGNNVWFSGVKIGTVSNLRFYSNSRVQVTINIELKAQEYIRKDSKIKIGSDGLIGNKIVVIYGGSAKSAEIQEGDTLEVEKTFTQEDMVNTLQENNKNLLAITADFKTISGKLASGDGTMGKLLSDNAVYDHINRATLSLQQASSKANQLLSSLSTFSAGLNKDGTLANELVTDTLVFQSIRSSMLQLKKITDTAAVFVTQLKDAGNNPASTLGVLIHDEPSGTRMKQTIKNLESSSRKLDQDLEAAQHSFLLRSFFRKKEKAAKRDSTTN